MRFLVFLEDGAKEIEARSVKEALLASGSVRAIPLEPSFVEKISSPKELSPVELAHVALDIQMMLKAGIPLMSALESVAESKEDMTARALWKIRKDIETGASPGKAFANAKVFPKLFVASVEVGDKHGKLEEIFGFLAKYYSSLGGIKSKIGIALIMPTATFVITMIILYYMIISLFPKLAEFAHSAGVRTITPIARPFIWMSNHRIISLIGIIIVTVLYVKYQSKILSSVKTGKGPNAYKLFLEHMDIYAVASTASMVLSVGMKVTDALKYSVENIRNKNTAKALKEAIKEIDAGAPIEKAFYKKHIPLVLRKVAIIGSKSGKLPEAFAQLAESMEENITNDVKTIEQTLPITSVLVISPIVFLVLVAFYGSYFMILNQVMAKFSH